MIENARLRRAPLTMMILDIDHFKRVNDTYGHDCGDVVLKGFAAQLRGIIRGGDLLCRLGGEEFVIVMPGVDAQAAARDRRARAPDRRRAGVRHRRRGRRRFRSPSRSASPSGADEGDPPSFIAARTRRSICSKSAGRNRVTQDAA